MDYALRKSDLKMWPVTLEVPACLYVHIIFKLVNALQIFSGPLKIELWSITVRL